MLLRSQVWLKLSKSLSQTEESTTNFTSRKTQLPSNTSFTMNQSTRELFKSKEAASALVNNLNLYPESNKSTILTSEN